MDKVIFRENNYLHILDQRFLPFEKKYFICKNFKDIVYAIKEMVLRGAPLIGITAAEAIFQIYIDNKDLNFSLLKEIYIKNIKQLKTSRPTAVDLFNVINIFLKDFENIKDKNQLYKYLNEFVLKIYNENDLSCKKIAEYGLKYLKKRFLREKLNILTHCNTGSLATASIGTALGIIRDANKYFEDLFVYVDETRPRLQGALLTAYELYKDNIKFSIITDNSAAFLMQKGLIDLVIVGADRIALNGDTANKIGTLNLAILSRYFSIPFLVAAPFSSIDLNLKTGKDIKIEQRDKKEVLNFKDFPITLNNFSALNYAFDITSGNLISAIITNKGIIYPPYKKEKFLSL